VSYNENPILFRRTSDFKEFVPSDHHTLKQGFKDFPKIYETPKNSRRQKGDTNQVP
jgi:hypothetical protein